jgi:hypothetical protein
LVGKSLGRSSLIFISWKRISVLKCEVFFMSVKTLGEALALLWQVCFFVQLVLDTIFKPEFSRSRIPEIQN